MINDKSYCTSPVFLLIECEVHDCRENERIFFRRYMRAIMAVSKSGTLVKMAVKRRVTEPLSTELLFTLVDGRQRIKH